MKVVVRAIIKDPAVSIFKDIEPTENVTLEETAFLDGPVSDRVAILDFDERSGLLRQGARFETQRTDRSSGYRVDGDLYSDAFVQVSTFGIVHKALYLYEDPDALGRRLRWAFDGPQLLVVPRAGEMENAFYQRESRSVQFFWFPDRSSERRVYTCLSQDIVAHETAHAVLDGIAPDLYHAINPESLAIHEAVADLTAVMCAFNSRALAKAVLQHENGSIVRSSAFSGLAEQFAEARDRNKPYLRDLLNTLKMGDVDASEPHALSEVLSGALYAAVVQLHEELKTEFAQSKEAAPNLVDRAEVTQVVDETPVPSAGPVGNEEARRRVAGKALAVAAQRFKRAVLRGLDYLPPGECSFVDLGRAILAADEAAHPASGQQRGWIVDQFVARGIVAQPTDLSVQTNFDEPALRDIDLATLVESDWSAYEFANRHRDLLHIPKDVPFRVRPRLDVTKKYYHRGGTQDVRECLFKVSWNVTEANDMGARFPSQRQISVGTTLAIDWETKRIRARLCSAETARDERPRKARDGFLRRLDREDGIRFGDAAPDGKPLLAAARAVAVGDVMRVFGCASLLHLGEV